MVAGVLQHVVKTRNTPVLSAADPERRASAPGLILADAPEDGAVTRGCPNHCVTKAARRIRTGTPFAWVGPLWEPLAGSSSLDPRIDLKRAHALRHAIHKRRSRGAKGRIIRFEGPFVATTVAVAVNILNHMLEMVRPNYVRTA
jgi:hypothetical protein